MRGQWRYETGCMLSVDLRKRAGEWTGVDLWSKTGCRKTLVRNAAEKEKEVPWLASLLKRGLTSLRAQLPLE